VHELACLPVGLQVKAAMVDSANDSISRLQSALAAARQDAAKASARAQEASAMAARHESAGCAALPVIPLAYYAGSCKLCRVSISTLTDIRTFVMPPAWQFPASSAH
jgi:hypothetical protein